MFASFGAFAGMLATGSTAAAAESTLCRADPAIVATGTADEMLTAAQALTTPLDRPRARALYLALLVRDPLDEEAAVGLAHVDAWDGCFVLAERGYREVLARSRGNVEARTGLADVLLWTDRWHEAQRTLDEGLAVAPLSPDLLSRRARVAYWSGDITAASRYLAEAARVSPLDPEVREARDRVFAGQTRLAQRVQLFPEGYDNVYTTEASAMQRWRRLRFEVGTLVATRVGAIRETRSGPIKTTIIDGRPSFGLFYHHDRGGWIGGTVAVSAPALSLPRYALGVYSSTPLGRVFSSLYLAAAYWQFADDRDVFVFNPALSRAITESIDVTLSYWLTSVLVHRDGADSLDVVHSFGARVGWRAQSRLTLGLDYTYGSQLERNPSAIELLQLRSHVFSLLARFMFDRSLGVDGSLSLEYRTSLGPGPSVFGPAAEAGVFLRW